MGQSFINGSITKLTSTNLIKLYLKNEQHFVLIKECVVFNKEISFLLFLLKMETADSELTTRLVFFKKTLVLLCEDLGQGKS